MKPRLGALFNSAKAEKLRAMLESSIQRRFPRGLKVHVHSVDRFGCLAQLTRTLKDAELSITRAKVRCAFLRYPRCAPFFSGIGLQARRRCTEVLSNVGCAYGQLAVSRIASRCRLPDFGGQ